ncbi:hypothetical protein O9929_03885 [Vibrio lentus]|nr:hypothetical protein [Vibrio lentus]
MKKYCTGKRQNAVTQPNRVLTGTSPPTTGHLGNARLFHRRLTGTVSRWKPPWRNSAHGFASPE